MYFCLGYLKLLGIPEYWVFENRENKQLVLQITSKLGVITFEKDMNIFDHNLKFLDLDTYFYKLRTFKHHMTVILYE